jgi:hypothetical protein
MSFSNFLILSMYDASLGDGWNDLSMSIGFTRYSPDSVRTRDRTTYSQFLNIAAKLPVGLDDTIIESFDIPCNLWPVVASLLFAGNASFYTRKQFSLKMRGSALQLPQVRIVPVRV